MRTLGSRTYDIPTLLRRLGYQSYRQYLESDHWKGVRKRYFRSKLVKRDSAGTPRCEYCDRTGRLNLHHKTYKSLGRENLNHLVLLCEQHHSVAHEVARESNLPLWSATKRGKRILRKQHKAWEKIYGRSTDPSPSAAHTAILQRPRS